MSLSVVLELSISTSPICKGRVRLAARGQLRPAAPTGAGWSGQSPPSRPALTTAVHAGSIPYASSKQRASAEQNRGCLNKYKLQVKPLPGTHQEGTDGAVVVRALLRHRPHVVQLDCKRRRGERWGSTKCRR